MKAVMPTVPQHFLDARRRRRADRWDEMWEGVLHMPPAPNRYHQKLEWEFETWLHRSWARPRGNWVFHQINVAAEGAWPSDYRIPDLVLVMPDRFHIDQTDYFDGAPTVVVEIHGPGDEAYEKLDFYARIGVPEAWIIDRDSRVPGMYVLEGGAYGKLPAGEDGWLTSRATGVELRAEPGGRLGVRIAGEPETRAVLPGE